MCVRLKRGGNKTLEKDVAVFLALDNVLVCFIRVSNYPDGFVTTHFWQADITRASEIVQKGSVVQNVDACVRINLSHAFLFSNLNL